MNIVVLYRLNAIESMATSFALRSSDDDFDDFAPDEIDWLT